MICMQKAETKIANMQQSQIKMISINFDEGGIEKANHS